MKKLFALIVIISLSSLLVGCGTALMQAAHKGDLDTMKVLIDKGADVNESSMGLGLGSGYTPLMIAARDGRLDAAKLLLDRGADVNKEVSGTALAKAAYYGHRDIVTLLLDRGADINKAIGEANKYDNRHAAQLLSEMKRERDTKQQATPVSKPSQEVSSSIKSDVDELPAVKAKSNKSAYAVVIGIELYRQKLPRADFAAQDAKTVTEYLTKTLGYPEENVVTLTNDRASLTDFIKYFEKWLPNNIESGSSVFVYYSGHGAPNTRTGDAFLVPYDGDPAFIDETGYSLKRMYAALGKLPAKEVIVALDSCFSGAGGRSVIAQGSRPLVMNQLSNVVLPKNVTVLSASSGDQTELNL